MAITSSSALRIGSLFPDTGFGKVARALIAGKLKQSATPPSSSVKTQAELDTEVRGMRVKRGRLKQAGVSSTPLGLAAIGTQKTLPKLTGE